MSLHRQRIFNYLLRPKYAPSELSTSDVLRWDGQDFSPGYSLPVDSYIQVEAWTLAFTDPDLNGFVTFDTASLQAGSDLSWATNQVLIATQGIYAAACLIERQAGTDIYTISLNQPGESFNPSQTVAADTTATGLTLLPTMMPADGVIQLEVNSVGDLTINAYLYVVRLA